MLTRFAYVLCNEYRVNTSNILKKRIKNLLKLFNTLLISCDVQSKVILTSDSDAKKIVQGSPRARQCIKLIFVLLR